MYTAAEFWKKPTLHISMQYFADAGGGGKDDGGTEDRNDDVKTGGEDQPHKDPTLKELLASNKAYQSEYDKMMSKAQETARQKWEADAKAKADEAAKLAKMEADEKLEYERKKREDELTKREAEITKRELRAEAVTQLTEKGLPASLADLLDCSSAENCKKSMEAAIKAFNEAVEKKTNDKLKGTAPGKGEEKQSGDAFLAGLGA